MSAKSVSFSKKEETKIRRYYVIEQLRVSEIAEELKCTSRQVSLLVHRKGWAKIRENHLDRVTQNSVIGNYTLIDDYYEYIETIRTKTMKVTRHGFDLADKSKDGYDFSCAANGITTAYEIYCRASMMEQHKPLVF